MQDAIHHHHPCACVQLRLHNAIQKAPAVQKDCAVELTSEPERVRLVIMQSPVNLLRFPRKDLSSADWSNLRPMITELYQNQRLTMDQVRDNLVVAGYRVTQRMVRARITQWNLHRNHQLGDMVAAMRLLELDSERWPSPEPRFLIRGHMVTMKEIVRYFRRKGIQDPLLWAHSTTVTCDQPHVTLLNENEQPSGLTTDGPGRPMQSSGADLLFIPLYHLTKNPSTLNERAVAGLQEYCLAYIGRGHLADQEPPVHQFTVHGLFGERMRDGLAHLMRNTSNAFPCFGHGFDLVHSLLSDCHPMALGQYLVVVCILATHQAHSILSSLLRYVSKMASALRVSTPVAEFLVAISSTDEVLCTAIMSLRAAVAVFAEQHSISWQGLYIQERLCDCLYYGNGNDEGSLYRARLSIEQELLHGPFARNVLYTLTNVASDLVHGEDIDSGQAKYMMVLRRAESLTGLGRAKIRFAALEGLAQSEQIRFENLHQPLSDNEERWPIRHLQNASLYIQDALHEAQTWFEQSSRRTVRALERQAHIENMIANMQYQPM